jgi:Tfp pilus assembly protein PilO
MKLTVERLWIGAGLGLAVVITAIAWFFAISPQHSQAADLRSQNENAQSQNEVLQHRLTALRNQNKNLAQYQATLAHDQAALPSTDGLSDFLRELQAVGASTLVTVTSVTVGSPAPVVAVAAAPAATASASPTATASATASTTAAPAVPTAAAYSIPINLSATGTTDQLSAFLDQLQTVQPRAVLVSHAAVSSASGPGDTTTLALTMNAFVAPAAQ